MSDADERKDREGLDPPLGADGGGGRRGRSSRRRTAVAAGLVILAAAAVLWYRSGGGPGADRPPAAAADADHGGETAADTALDLPELSASDEFLRRMARGLSSRPGWAAWLVTDELARRFVRAVVLVGAGSSPREELGFMAPEGGFLARESGGAAAAGRTTIDPASYRRYDRATAIFVSLDTEGTARLYRRLRPLLDEAYRELGFPGAPFDAAMARAVEALLAVPVPEGPIEIVPSGGEAWEFRDPELATLDPAQKHLLRMGPENARRVQRKLREMAAAMDLPTPAASGD